MTGKSTVAALCIAMATSATLGGIGPAAAGPLEDMYFQMRLVREGFLDGPTDGQIGPATRAAMSAYAKKFNVEANREAVEADMLRRAGNARGATIDDAAWQAATDAARSLLRDPFSAQFTPLYYFKGSDGGEVICGLVNAKNLYGAYTGDQFFQASIMKVMGDPVAVASLDGADQACALGVSSSDFRG